jgi:hypothetical protein
MIVLQMDNNEDRQTLLVVIIEKDNFHRLQQADPITLENGTQGGFLKTITYPENFRMVIAYEEDSGRLYEMMQQGRAVDMLKDIMRGYRFTRIDGKRTTDKGWKQA